jgi:hypothetical protein
MQADQDKINQLIEFKQRDKFSTQAWEDRGLNSSNDQLCTDLSLFFNACADKLVASIEQGDSAMEMKRLLKSQLARLDKHYYDTEEKEFICDLFHELASVVGVDLKNSLNRWLYGPVLVILMKIMAILRPERIVETLSKPCASCETKLETHILRKENGIPDYSWLIVKCNNCGELNLLSHGPNVKLVRYGNYEYVESLQKEEFSYEQAMTRLEQIKFFRK